MAQRRNPYAGIRLTSSTAKKKDPQDEPVWLSIARPLLKDAEEQIVLCAKENMARFLAKAMGMPGIPQTRESPSLGNVKDAEFTIVDEDKK